MDALLAAIERGDVEAFVELGRDAIDAGDVDTVRSYAKMLRRLPAAFVDGLRDEVRLACPDAVAGLPGFTDTRGTEPLPPTTPLDRLLSRAIDGDRDGALAALAAGAIPEASVWHRPAAAMIRRVPMRASLPRPLVVDRGEEVLISEAGERGTIVVFTGLGDRSGLDLPNLDAWIADAGYRGVYLRDRSRGLYTQGIHGIDRPAFDALLRRVRDGEAGQTVFLGTSAGGFGAIYWAALLGIARTLAFSAPTSLDRRRVEKIGDRRLPVFQRFVLPHIDGVDLRDHLRETGHAGRIDLHYGERAKLDCLHAEYLRGPRIRHFPLAGWAKHHVLPRLAATGRLRRILRGGEGPAGLSPSNAPAPG